MCPSNVGLIDVLCVRKWRRFGERLNRGTLTWGWRDELALGRSGGKEVDGLRGLSRVLRSCLCPSTLNL